MLYFAFSNRFFPYSKINYIKNLQVLKLEFNVYMTYCCHVCYVNILIIKEQIIESQLLYRNEGKYEIWMDRWIFTC